MAEYGMLISVLISMLIPVAGLIVIGLVLWFYRDNLAKALGCLSTMAGVLIFGVGWYLYYLIESLGGGRTYELLGMMAVGAILVGVGVLVLSLHHLRAHAEEALREGPDQDGT